MDELAELTVDECWQRLGPEGVGRIGFDRGRGPRIHPVNYTAADGTLYVRTSGSSELGSFVDMFADGAWVSFEVDHLVGDDRWSVLVVARASRPDLVGGDELPPDRIPVPTPGGPHDTLVRLTPVEVTGRRLAATGPEDPGGRTGG